MDKTQKSKDGQAPKDTQTDDQTRDVAVIRIDSNRNRKDGFAPRLRQGTQSDSDHHSRSGRKGEDRQDRGRGREDRQDRGREDRQDRGRGRENRQGRGRGREDRQDRGRGREDRQDRGRGRERDGRPDRGRGRERENHQDQGRGRTREDRKYDRQSNQRNEYRAQQSGRSFETAYSEVSPARQVAWKTLRQLFDEEAFLQPALASLADQAELSLRDRRLAWELVLGVSRRWGTLTAYLNELLKQGIESVSGDTHRALALGAYQLLYLDKIPAYAAVNDSVNLVKEEEPYLAGVANRVLKLLEQEGAPDLSSLRPDDRLAAELSHPAWWVRRQKKAIGLAATRKLAEAHNLPAPLSIRLSPQQDMEHARTLLEDEGAKLTELTWAKGGFKLELDQPFNQPSHQQGTWYVQDEASQLVTLLLNPEPGARVWDMCAAPGGKSLTLLSMIGPEGSLLSTDLHERKAMNLRSRLASFPQVDVQVHDAMLGMPEGHTHPFDAVLLDAPCSALGVIRRHPEIRWRRTLKDIKRAAKRQLKLMETAALALKVGGILVYSVCTDTSEETDEVVSAFLKAFPDFAVAPPAMQHPWNTVVHQGALRLNAADHNTDGFFAVRFTRLR